MQQKLWEEMNAPQRKDSNTKQARKGLHLKHFLFLIWVKSAAVNALSQRQQTQCLASGHTPFFLEKPWMIWSFLCIVSLPRFANGLALTSRNYSHVKSLTLHFQRLCAALLNVPLISDTELMISEIQKAAFFTSNQSDMDMSYKTDLRVCMWLVFESCSLSITGENNTVKFEDTFFFSS